LWFRFSDFRTSSSTFNLIDVLEVVDGIRYFLFFSIRGVFVRVRRFAIASRKPAAVFYIFFVCSNSQVCKPFGNK
jgi:hypothetical protein